MDLGQLLASQTAVPESGTAEREQIEYIDIERLDADPNNFYELSNVDELATNIQLLGLQQPLRVRAVGRDRFVIVSGHRRWTALRKLVEEGHNELREAPCIRERSQGSAALQELRLIFANSDTRRMSSADISKQAERVETLLYQLKEEGYEFPGRMRDHVAQACKVSKSKLSRLKVIQKGLHPVFKPHWESGVLKEATAYALAQLPEDQQHRIFCRQNNASGKFEYLYENDVRQAKEHLDSIWSLSCSKQGGTCTNCEGKWAHIAGKSYYYGNCHKQCCADCADLVKCRNACPLLGDRIRELKENAKLQKQQEKAAQEAKDRPIVEEIEKLWQRFGEARTEANKSVQHAYRAAKMMWAKSDDAKHIDMELGIIKFTPQSSLPYGYTVRLDDIHRLVALADLFDVSLDYLLCRSEEPYPKAVPSWTTKKPKKPCDVVAIFNLDGTNKTKMLCRWNGHEFLFKANGAKIEMDPIKWMEVPKEE